MLFRSFGFDFFVGSCIDVASRVLVSRFSGTMWPEPWLERFPAVGWAGLSGWAGWAGWAGCLVCIISSYTESRGYLIFAVRIRR